MSKADTDDMAEAADEAAAGATGDVAEADQWHADNPSTTAFRTDQEKVADILGRCTLDLARARNERDALNQAISNDLLPAYELAERAARIYKISLPPKKAG